MSTLPQHTTGLRPLAFTAFILIFIIALSTPAENRVQFKTWNTENGLPQNTVNSIVQTPDRYIWLGTFDGLARFDGARFTVFKKSNTPALPMNRVLSLAVDSVGRLWIWTEDPNTLVVYEQGKFRAFVKGVDFNADYIYHASLAEGGLRLQSGNDIYVYSDGKFERRPGQRLELPRVSYDLDSGLAWINTNDGYYAVNGKQSDFYKKDAQVPVNRRKLTVADSVEIDGSLWLFVPFSPREYRLSVFRNGQLHSSSVKVQAPRFLKVDHEGNFWIGEFYDGIRKIAAASISPDDFSQLKVEHFLQVNGLVSNYITTGLVDRDDNIWIGTDKGMQLLIDEPIVTVYSKASGLPADNTYSIVEDKAGNIWFGAWDNYLLRYANGIFTPELEKWVQALFVDRDGRL